MKSLVISFLVLSVQSVFAQSGQIPAEDIQTIKDTQLSLYMPADKKLEELNESLDILAKIYQDNDQELIDQNFENQKNRLLSISNIADQRNLSMASNLEVCREIVGDGDIESVFSRLERDRVDVEGLNKHFKEKSKVRSIYFLVHDINSQNSYTKELNNMLNECKSKAKDLIEEGRRAKNNLQRCEGETGLPAVGLGHSLGLGSMGF